LVRRGFGEFDDSTPDTRIGRTPIGLKKAQCTRFGKQPKGGRQIGELVAGRLEQFANRNVKHSRDARQPACTYPIYAPLVFLYLLKGNSDLLGKVGLAYSAMNTKDAYLGSYHDVEWVGHLGRHYKSPQGLLIVASI
jgi:hypothetical protein